MSTEVEQQPVQAQPAVEEPVAAEAQPAANDNNGVEANKEEKKAKKEVAPIDPKEDFIGWVGQQIPNAIHKFNFYILQWAVNLAYDDETKKPKLPINEEVTKSQFLAYLKDGQLLAHLANKLAPGSVEQVKEGEENKTKEDNKANIEGFIKFAKEKAQLAEQQIFSAEDLLEKGKAGFSQVLNTVFQLAHVAQERFQQQGLDLDALITEIAGIAPKSIIEKIRSFVFNKLRRSSSVDKDVAGAVKEAEKTETNGDANGAPAAAEEAKPAEDETKEAPAVAAN